LKIIFLNDVLSDVIATVTNAVTDIDIVNILFMAESQAVFKAEYAAPNRAALSLRMTRTGMFSSRSLNLPLFTNAFMKVPSFNLGSIWGGMPPPK